MPGNEEPEAFCGTAQRPRVEGARGQGACMKEAGGPSLGRCTWGVDCGPAPRFRRTRTYWFQTDHCLVIEDALYEI